MSHDEALDLLPAYALGALDADSDALDAHVAGCAICTAQLAAYLEVTSRLAGAVPLRLPPPELRAAVLNAAPVQRAARSRRARTAGRRFRVLAPLAATIILALGLASFAAAQNHQLQAERLALVTDERGLALLTSTETTVERLAPVAAIGDQAHGHWYHHAGIATQVVVVEFMPPPPAGQAYFGWLLLADGTIRPIGRFVLDATGYGRIILAGSDGVNVRTVEVTRQTADQATSPGIVVLRWSGT